MILKAAALLASASIVTVGPAANHHRIGVRLHTRIQVRLPANASTGYHWKVMSPPTPVLGRGPGRYLPAKKTVFVGAPGTYVQSWVARRKGKTTIRLAYLRTTTPPTPPAKRYSLTVIVR